MHDFKGRIFVYIEFINPFEQFIYKMKSKSVSAQEKVPPLNLKEIRTWKENSTITQEPLLLTSYQNISMKNVKKSENMVNRSTCQLDTSLNYIWSQKDVKKIAKQIEKPQIPSQPFYIAGSEQTYTSRGRRLKTELSKKKSQWQSRLNAVIFHASDICQLLDQGKDKIGTKNDEK